MPYGRTSFVDGRGCWLKIWIPTTSREPAPTQNYTRINIGDVGFIRRGQFHLLFSAGSPLGERQLGDDVPVTFEELNVGTPVSSEPRRPGCLHTPTVRQVGTGLDVTGFTTLYVHPFGLSSTGLKNPTPRLLETGANFSFELTGDRGAALVTRFPTYCEDSLLESTFRRYTVRHYESWVAFARHKEYGDDIQPVLVSGLDMTRDFAMVAYSNESTPLGSSQPFAIPMFASPSFRGTWRTRYSPHINHGPRLRSPPPRERAIYSPPPLNWETRRVSQMDSINVSSFDITPCARENGCRFFQGEDNSSRRGTTRYRFG